MEASKELLQRKDIQNALVSQEFLHLVTLHFLSFLL